MSIIHINIISNYRAKFLCLNAKYFCMRRNIKKPVITTFLLFLPFFSSGKFLHFQIFFIQNLSFTCKIFCMCKIFARRIFAPPTFFALSVIRLAPCKKRLPGIRSRENACCIVGYLYFIDIWFYAHWAYSVRPMISS